MNIEAEAVRKWGKKLRKNTALWESLCLGKLKPQIGHYGHVLAASPFKSTKWNVSPKEKRKTRPTE